MRVHIGSIKHRRGASITRQFTATVPSPFGEEGRWTGPAHVDVKITQSGKRYVVAGELIGEAHLTCHRCLKPFETEITVPIDEYFYAASPAPRSDVDDDEDNDADGGEDTDDGHAFTGDHFDLTPIVHEYALMASPIKALCDEACRGLCSQCGADLNDGECGCDRELPDPRFAVLKDLFPSDE